MKNSTCRLVILLLLSGCANLPSEQISDRLGIISVRLPSHWYDDTDHYLAEMEKIHLKRTPDSGIESLLMLKRHDNMADCKFRELRYTPDEVGYRWDLEKLAAEVAYVRNRMMMNYDIGNYLQHGVDLPCCKQERSYRTIRISSESVKLNNIYTAWQIRYKHWFGPKGNNDTLAFTLTTTLNGKEKIAGVPAKYYVVAECAVDGKDKAVIDSVEKDIKGLLNTINLNHLQVDEKAPRYFPLPSRT